MTQCYAIHAFRELARLFRAAGDAASQTAWAAEAEKLSEAFHAAFWRGDHFGEYVHPKRGLVDLHGLSDVNWAAVAFGIVAGREAGIALAAVVGSQGLLVGRHADANRIEAASLRKMGIRRAAAGFRRPLNDAAAMGRAWYLEALACQRMKAHERLVESARKSLSAAKADGYWRERYHAAVERHGRARRRGEILRICRHPHAGRVGKSRACSFAIKHLPMETP